MIFMNRNLAKTPWSYKTEWIEHGFTGPAILDNFLSRDPQRISFGNTGVSTPAVNIVETNTDFRLEMVAPGMKKEDFKVELEKNELTVSYDHEDNREGERREWNYRTREYNYHSFQRSFALPETVEVEKIQAKYENGILNVIIPKRKEAWSVPPRQITIS